MFIYLMHFWCWEFRFAETQRWTILIYRFLVTFALLLYVLSSLVFPENMSDHDNYCDYFYLCAGAAVRIYDVLS